MRTAIILCILAVVGPTLAVPRKEALHDKRQAASCSCASDVLITDTSITTMTRYNTATITTDAGSSAVTADESTDVTTLTRTTTVQASSVASTTTTIGGSTIRTNAPPTTITIITSLSSTVTTCKVSAYKVKRQNSGAMTTAAPTTTITTNFGTSNARPNTCLCRLVSAYPLFTTSSDTSPVQPSSSADSCSCPTSTTTVVSTVAVTSTTTTVLSDYETYTVIPATTSVSYSDTTITSTKTITFTVSQARVTITSQSTATATTTLTPTYISCPTPEATCNNAGVRWAIYKNTNAAGANNTNRDKTYSSFDPTVFKQRQPMYQNVTYTLGGFDYPAAQPVVISFYNSTQKFESDYIAINHVGYLFAQVSGTYTFNISKSDDITILWVGDLAYSGWTRDNANIINPYGSGTSSYKVNLVQGSYTPFRIMFGNAQEAIVFQTSLTAPDGTVILTSNSRRSPYLVQYTCDNTTAPPFAPFGSET